MPVKAIVTGIVLVIMVTLLVYMVEYFLPLSMKAELDMLCRSALLQMENSGGLSSDEKQRLRSDLEEKGLEEVVVTATSDARQGSMLTLYVEGYYTCNKLTALFRREDIKIRMTYNKSSMSRRVVN